MLAEQCLEGGSQLAALLVQGRQTVGLLVQLLFECGAPGLELGEPQFILAQRILQRGQLGLGTGQCRERALTPLAFGVALPALIRQPGVALGGVDGVEFGVQGVFCQGLLRLGQATIGLLQLLAAAGHRRHDGTVLAFEFIALTLGLLPRLPGLGQLLLLLRLLGGQLRGFRRVRRLVAEGVVETATYRARLVFPQRFAQAQHARATGGAAAFDEVVQGAVVALACVEPLAGGLAQGGQLGLALLILGQAFVQLATAILGAPGLLPVVFQLPQGQAAACGQIVSLLGRLSRGVESFVVAQQLTQGGLPLVALALVLELPGFGLPALLGQSFGLLAAVALLRLEFGQLVVQGGKRLGVLACLVQNGLGLLAALASGVQLPCGLIPSLLGGLLVGPGPFEGLERLAMRVLQRSSLAGQRGLAQQAMALGRQQAPAFAI